LSKRSTAFFIVEVEITTEDGSQGHMGLVSDFLSNLLKKNSQIDLLYACDPLPMLKKIAQLSLKYKIPCQASLEETMGCGIGACRGCTIMGVGGYLRVCRDEPFFQTNQILWNRIQTD